jgi:hypothetical protein
MRQRGFNLITTMIEFTWTGQATRESNGQGVCVLDLAAAPTFQGLISICHGRSEHLPPYPRLRSVGSQEVGLPHIVLGTCQKFRRGTVESPSIHAGAGKFVYLTSYQD